MVRSGPTNQKPRSTSNAKRQYVARLTGRICMGLDDEIAPRPPPRQPGPELPVTAEDELLGLRLPTWAISRSCSFGPYLDLMPWTGGNRMGTVPRTKSAI